jgi:hypothetical protein
MESVIFASLQGAGKSTFYYHRFFAHTCASTWTCSRHDIGRIVSFEVLNDHHDLGATGLA